MRRAVIFAAVTALAAGAAMAQQQSPAAKQQQGRMPFFQALDTNNDGVVSQEEFTSGHTANQRFAAVDTNKDGVVSREEFMQAGQQRRERKFSKMDKDNNGQLTQEELRSNAIAMFRAMDDNGDGRITPDEVGRHHGGAKKGWHGQQQQGRMPSDAPYGPGMGPGWGQ